MKSKKSSHEAIFNVLRQISYTKLFKKYSSGDYSYNKITINNLVFNQNCLAVARFKDFLIYDDNTEFLRRFYANKDRKQRLTKILNFYEKYSKIFPNYLVLKENKYLYRNIRKKQKMIDAFNEIKREEKENRKKLKNKEKDKKNDLNELFSKKIKNEIKAFQKNISFKQYKNSFDSDKNNDDTLMINQNSISIYYKQFQDEENDNNNDKNLDSFITNQTNGSITNIVNALNDNKIYTKDLPNILAQNNYKDNIKKTKNKKIKDMNTKIKKKTNVQKKTNKNQNSIKIINDTSAKEENLLSKHIKNNSQSDMKKITEKNNFYKYAVTSSNATNSSSIISKKIKNQQTSSSINKTTKENNENKNNNTIPNNKENNNINNNSSKNIIPKVNTMNSTKNIYQKTTPNFGKFGLKKHFYKTNNNFKRNISNKSTGKNNRENTQKNNDDIKKTNKKEKYTINKEIIKKKYIKAKHISQDFDSNIIYKMTENILNDKNIINTNNNILKTECNCKNFLTNDNPNLITGDTKPNERNEKNFMEDKVLVNVRDIIKQEKEKEKDTKNKKLFYTAQKSKNKLLKLTKSKQNESQTIKSLKFYNTKKNYLNTIDNNNLNNKKKLDKINDNYNENQTFTNNNNIRNNSAITKQKTEQKIIKKKFMTKEQKTKTKAIFAKHKIKNTENKKLLINSSENFNKTKKLFKKNNNIEDKKDINKINNSKNKNKQLNKNKSNKLYEIKNESNLLSPFDEHQNKTERIMTTYLSDINIKNSSQNLTPEKKEQYKFETKNNISKNNKKLHLNNSAKFSNDILGKKYKSFMTKNKNKSKNEINHNSQKDLLSMNILHRIKEVKENKTQNDFYRTVKLKHSIKNNGNNLKTPVVKNKKMNYIKNRLNKRIKNDNSIGIGNRTKEEMMHNYMSSFSIKVNKTNYNKEKTDKNKNLKKTWTKNMKNVVSQINSNISNEVKK